MEDVKTGKKIETSTKEGSAHRRKEREEVEEGRKMKEDEDGRKEGKEGRKGGKEGRKEVKEGTFCSWGSAAAGSL